MIVTLFWLIVVLLVVAGITLGIYALERFDASTRLDSLDQLSGLADLDALLDEQIQTALGDNQKITAIKRYRDLTGADLKTAKAVIDEVYANPDKLKRSKRLEAPEADGAGIRDLVKAGEIDEAIRVYAAFMGVDQFTAKAAIEAMAAEYDDYDDEYYDDNDSERRFSR